MVDQSSSYPISHSHVGVMSAMSDSVNPSLQPHIPPVDVEGLACLSYEDPGSARVTNALLNSIDADDSSDLRDKIKSIKVAGFGSLANFTAISSAVKTIKELRTLEWHCQAPMPGVILDALSIYHPDCKLRYDMQFSNWDKYADNYVPIQAVGNEPHREVRAQARRLIVGSTILHSLKAHIGYGSQPDAESLKLIYDVLSGCPNLRELDLSISHSGCVVSWPQPYSFDFTESSASFAPLEVLRLRDYRLDDPYDGQILRYARFHPAEDDLRWPWNSLPSWMVHRLWDWFEPLLYDVIQKPWTPKPDKCPSGNYCKHDFTASTNLDGWLERMDFSKLQTVEFGSMSVVSLLKLQKAGVLTNVSNLHIHGGNKCFADLLPDFISALRKPLSTLCLSNIHFGNLDTLLPAVAKHGDSLTSLHLTEHQESRGLYCDNSESCKEDSLMCRAFGHGRWYHPHLYLNTSHLRILSSTCPKIAQLDIDLDRNPGTLNPDFDSIASLPDLSALVLRFESPTFQSTRAGTRSFGFPYFGGSDLFDPLFNKSSVLKIFQQLRQTQLSNAIQAENAVLSTYEVIDPLPPTPTPALHELTVYIGPFASRYSHGMAMSEKYVLGRFHCSLTTTGDEVCTGGIAFPYDIITGYEDSYAYGLDVNQSTLDKNGLWDPSTESEAVTYKRRLKAAEERVRSIKSMIESHTRGYDKEGTKEGLEEVLDLLEVELEALRSEVVRNVAGVNGLVSGTEETFKLQQGRIQEQDEEDAEIRY